jgi:hypothetical protein
MKIRNTLWIACACWLGLLAVPSKAQTDPGFPHLRKQGTATQLIVDGKPFVVLTGEIEGDDATSLENMRWMWPEMDKMHLNTVLPAAYWELVEPEERRFDFTLVDGIIREARHHNLRIGLVIASNEIEMAVTFTPGTPGPPLVGAGTVEEGSFVPGRWVEGRHLDRRVTVLDSDCTYCEAAVLVPGAYRNRDIRSEHNILRVSLYRYQ